jgi:hypothetical protein
MFTILRRTGTSLIFTCKRKVLVTTIDANEESVLQYEALSTHSWLE